MLKDYAPTCDMEVPKLIPTSIKLDIKSDMERR